MEDVTLSEIVSDLREAAYDVAAVVVPARYQPSFLIMRTEKEKARQAIRQYARELDKLRFEEDELVSDMCRFSKTKERLIAQAQLAINKRRKEFPGQTPSVPMQFSIFIQQADNDLIEKARTLCTLRVVRNSLSESKNRTEQFYALLRNMASDADLIRSIENFNLAMSKEKEKLKTQTQAITRAFQKNVDAQTQFQESFKESVNDTLTDGEISGQLQQVGGLIGLNLTGPAPSLDQNQILTGHADLMNRDAASLLS